MRYIEKICIYPEVCSRGIRLYCLKGELGSRRWEAAGSWEASREERRGWACAIITLLIEPTHHI